MPSSSRGVAYNRVANSDDVETAAAPTVAASTTNGDIEAPAVTTTTASSSSVTTTKPVTSSVTNKKRKQNDKDCDAVNEGEADDCIVVIVMDPAQCKFEVSVDVNWTVLRLKQEGVQVHKIAVSQQRLIYMGRLLADDVVLKDAKIDRAGIIVHLFPKPRVVLQSSVTTADHDVTSSNNNNNNDHHSTTTGGAAGGAHVPQIILDPEEAQLRSQILVLGSAEIMDAQNNVKLLSFLLLIITSMELLALFTIALGAPPTGNAPNGGTDMTDDATASTVRVWQTSDYFDLALNVFGLYAALLGIQATTENTRRLAFRYFICTVVCGILWNAFYYYLNYKVEKTMDEEVHNNSAHHNHNGNNNDPAADGGPPMSQRDLLVQAFFAILIPVMIWILCCLRAYQFHSLLQDAEQEAEERIQNLLTVHRNDDDGDDDVEHARNHDDDNDEDGNQNRDGQDTTAGIMA